MERFDRTLCLLDLNLVTLATKINQKKKKTKKKSESLFLRELKETERYLRRKIQIMGWDKFDLFFLKNKEEASEITKMGEIEKKKERRRLGFCR